MRQLKQFEGKQSKASLPTTICTYIYIYISNCKHSSIINISCAFIIINIVESITVIENSDLVLSMRIEVARYTALTNNSKNKLSCASWSA